LDPPRRAGRIKPPSGQAGFFGLFFCKTFAKRPEGMLVTGDLCKKPPFAQLSADG